MEFQAGKRTQCTSEKLRWPTFWNERQVIRLNGQNYPVGTGCAREVFFLFQKLNGTLERLESVCRHVRVCGTCLCVCLCACACDCTCTHISIAQQVFEPGITAFHHDILGFLPADWPHRCRTERHVQRIKTTAGTSAARRHQSRRG